MHVLCMPETHPSLVHNVVGVGRNSLLGLLARHGNKMIVGRRDTAGMPVDIGRMKWEVYHLGANLVDGDCPPHVAAFPCLLLQGF